jgi:hypothetical protein
MGDGGRGGLQTEPKAMSFMAVLADAASTSFIAIEAAAASSGATEGESDIAGEAIECRTV